MTVEECWQTYVGDVSPEEFVREFDSRDPAECARQYVEARGVVYGIVRRRLWRDTFGADDQHSRDTVTNLIAARLEETREAWEAVPISAAARRAPSPVSMDAAAVEDADDGDTAPLDDMESPEAGYGEEE